MGYEPIDWQPLEQITSRKLNQMAANSLYLEDRKISGSLRNMSPDKTPRSDLPFIHTNLVMLAEYRDISPGGKPTGKNKHRGKRNTQNQSPTFRKVIEFPDGFFDPGYLPVIIASVGAKKGLKSVSCVVTDISAKSFTVIIREEGGKKFTQSMSYFISYVVIGVKN